MSKIKELKNHANSQINIIDIVELFSPEKKSKYTELLFNMMKNTKALKDHSDEVIEHLINSFSFITKEDLSSYSDIQILMIYRFLDAFFNTKDLVDFRKFCEYNERNLVEQNDLTKYKSFDDIIAQLNMAELKVEAKELEGQIIKIHEDSDYLIIRPLTFFASKKYGANTKWCTTQEGGEHFNRYNKKGVLIYCIGKTNGHKVAAFYSLEKNEPEFSWWDAKDTRIDSMQSKLPRDIKNMIEDYCFNTKVKTNHEMLTTESRKKEELLAKNNYRDLNPKKEILNSRINAAIRRENELYDSETAEVAYPTEAQVEYDVTESNERTYDAG